MSYRLKDKQKVWKPGGLLANKCEKKLGKDITYRRTTYGHTCLLKGTVTQYF